MAVGKKRLGVSRVDKDRAENQAAKPNHRAAEIKRTRLHHGKFRLYRPHGTCCRKRWRVALTCRREADRETASKCPSSSRPHKDRSARWREKSSSASG